MSQLADVQSTFRTAGRAGLLSEKDATDMYIEVTGDLEWDVYNFDYKAEGRAFNVEIMREQDEASMDLFGVKYHD